MVFKTTWRMKAAMPGSKSVATWKMYSLKNPNAHPATLDRKSAASIKLKRNQSMPSETDDASLYSRRPYEEDNENLLDCAAVSSQYYIELTERHKMTVRVIRRMKYFVARRKFQQAKRPYDVRDVIEQYSQGNMDLMIRIKELQRRMDQVLGQPKKTDRDRTKYTVTARLQRLEDQISHIEEKINKTLEILMQLPLENMVKPQLETPLSVNKKY